MNKSKWNWTGNPRWDNYCFYTGKFILMPACFIIGFLIGQMLFGGK